MNPIIATMIRSSGRSWWQCRFSDGRTVAEWDTLTDAIHLPLGDGHTSRWELVPKKGMVGLRLLCPNGMCGELEAPEGFKFFQLKAGGMMVGQGGNHHFIDAHIIGVVRDTEGNCFCRAWEYGTARLIQFYDNVLNMQYCHIGRLSLDVQGVKI